jgi:hypothetical protein
MTKSDMSCAHTRPRYIKGGWATTKIETFSINPATGISGGTSDWESGWTVGGGVDYMFTPNWIARIDSTLFMNFTTFDVDRPAPSSPVVGLKRHDGLRRTRPLSEARQTRHDLLRMMVAIG